MDAEVAWAAGLFEGEGTFRLARRQTSRTERRYGQAVLSMTDEDVVRRFHAAVDGLGRVRCIKRTPTPGRTSIKPMWTWWVTNRDEFLRFCALVEPWLGARRTLQMTNAREGMTPAVLGGFGRRTSDGR